MYIDLLKPHGITWVVCSMFVITVNFDIVNRKRSSTIGIDFCVENNIYPTIRLISISDLNLRHQKS